MPRPAKPAAKQRQPIYQFKVVLVDLKPAIWRRIQVPEGTLDDLHVHIQTAMGWENYHLYEFEIGDLRYGDPAMQEDAWDDRCIDSTGVRLSQLFAKELKSYRFSYQYDFSDGWRHQIIYEGTVAPEPGATYPRCIAGARACPLEDSGGPWNYPELLRKIGNPRHEEYEGLREWLGGDFDPEAFDAETATRDMQRGRSKRRDDD